MSTIEIHEKLSAMQNDVAVICGAAKAYKIVEGLREALGAGKITTEELFNPKA